MEVIGATVPPMPRFQKIPCGPRISKGSHAIQDNTRTQEGLGGCHRSEIDVSHLYPTHPHLPHLPHLHTMSAVATLGNTLGAAYLGVVASSILFGVTNLQTYIYFNTYPRDWLLQKLSVYALWFLDAFHLSLTIHAVYHYLIDSFGDFAAQEVIVWSFKLQIAVNVFIILLVQTLYAIRVWKLGTNFHRFLPWIVIVVVFCGYGIGIILAVETYKIDSFLDLDTISWAIYLSFSSATFVDLVIAIAMCFYLQRSRSGFSITNSKIVTLMQYVLVSGLATSACSMTALITFAVLPHTLIFLGIEFLLTKLYINSFLAMLNARSSIRDRTEDGVSVSVTKIRTTTYPSPSSPTNPDSKNFIPLSPLSATGRQEESPIAEGLPYKGHLLESTDTFPINTRENNSVYQWPPAEPYARAV